jgi:hypothetical protein
VESQGARLLQGAKGPDLLGCDLAVRCDLHAGRFHPSSSLAVCLNTPALSRMALVIACHSPLLDQNLTTQPAAV